jgi:hypothetical protein
VDIDNDPLRPGQIFWFLGRTGLAVWRTDELLLGCRFVLWAGSGFVPA